MDSTDLDDDHGPRCYLEGERDTAPPNVNCRQPYEPSCPSNPRRNPGRTVRVSPSLVSEPGPKIDPLKMLPVRESRFHLLSPFQRSRFALPRPLPPCIRSVDPSHSRNCLHRLSVLHRTNWHH